MTEWTPREWIRRQGRPKTRSYPPPGSWVAKNSQRPASVETVQGGIPPYGVKETLVVNGKEINNKYSIKLIKAIVEFCFTTYVLDLDRVDLSGSCSFVSWKLGILCNQ